MTTYRRIEAINKAFDILSFLANQTAPTAGADVARAVNLAMGTTMCHLATLEDRGAVAKVGDYWQLGMGLALFWARVKTARERDITTLKNDLTALETGDM
jgi:DNA-binding IclR family transcriptional regulator